MAFQPLDMPFGALDTKTDERMLPPGALIVAENCSAHLVGGYTKRFGYAALAAASVFGGSMLRLASHGNELLASDGCRLMSYRGPSLDAWNDVRAGALPGVTTSQTNIGLDQGSDFTIGTRATANGVTLHVWRGTFGIEMSAVSVATGAVLAKPNPGAGTFDVVHAVAAGNNIAVFYLSKAAQTLKFAVFDTTTLAISGTPGNFQSGAAVSATLAAFDVSPFNSTDIIIAWYSATPNVRVARWNVSTQSTSAGPTVMSTEVLDSGLAVIASTAGVGAILYHSTAAGGVRMSTFDPTTTVQALAPFSVEAVTAPIAINCGLAIYDFTNVMAVWDRAATGITKGKTHFVRVTTAGVVGTKGTCWNSALASKPIVDRGPGSFFGTELILNLWAPNVGQYTYFTMRFPATAGGTPQRYAIAMHAYRTAYTAAQITGQLTDVDTISANVYAFSAPIAYKFLSTASPRAGWATFGLDFASPSRLGSVEALGDTYFAGGACAKYDGEKVVENNFLLYPEITQATVGTVASGGMDNGKYTYVVVFENSSATGNTDRSTPSLPVSATIGSGAGTGKVTLTIDTPFPSRLGTTLVFTTGYPRGIASVFRTLADAVADPATGLLTYRFVGSVDLDQTVASLTFVDSSNDSAIASNRLLYTNGGIIEREPCPPSTQLILHKNRVWGISSADPKVLFYSGELIPGEAVWFSSLQQLRIEAGGDTTAIASMDDKLIAFKADRIFKIYGSGVNQLGQQNDLSAAILMTGDAGCTDRRSIVRGHGGLYFKSAKGLYAISRGEEVSYAGENADKYWSSYSNIVAANMLTDQQELRFEVSGGAGVGDALTGAAIAAQKMVLNYVTGQWTTHRNYLDATAADAIVVNGVYYWTDANGNVYKESSTSFLDPAATYVRMLIRTGWAKPFGLQGWGRTQRAMLLGNRKTDHQLTLTCENDYVAGTTTATKTWTAAQIASLPREQVNLHLVRQKGESYRFTLYDGANGTLGTGEGYAAYGLQLLAQALRGTFEKKLLAAARG